MAEYAVVNKTQLDADMTSVADTIRTKGGTSEKLSWPDGYKAAVEAIQTGGGIKPPASKTLDPDVVYAMTRPADWLPMPTPGDDEIYILCHVMDGLTATFKANLTITGAVTVEFGTIADGVFVAQESLSKTSSDRVSHVINSASYGDLTEDGMVQCMVRIKGPVTEFNGVPSEGPHPGVDFVCGINLRKCAFGYIPSNIRCWLNLRYVSFVGNGGAKNLYGAFYFCTKLICVRCEKDNIISDAYNLFSECRNLIAVSEKFISGSDGAITLRSMLYNCSLKDVPSFKAKASSINNLFANSAADTADFTNIDTTACTDFGNVLRYAYSIAQVKNLDISNLTTVSYSFSHLINLSYITFAGETTPGGFTIDLADAKGMRHAALVDTINSLPTAIAAATLGISDCSGKSELTEEEIAVATAKNWTLTI